MVHELHKLGYQRLRIVPGMAPSGVYWRVGITTIHNVLSNNGAMCNDFGIMARYTTGMDNRYFDWEDAKTDTATQLAAKFVDRFPDIARDGKGRDWEYAGWYVEMLGFAELDAFPVAYDDWIDEKPSYLTRKGDRTLPYPPPGFAIARPDWDVPPDLVAP